MMGVGKSTIGKFLAEKLNMTFIDIDSLIIEHEKLTINKIFKDKGEEYFRKTEKSLTLKSMEKKDCVIALGGGSFLDSQIREIALKKCISFWLDLDIKELVKRLKRNENRPLLKEGNIEENLKSIIKKREEFYRLDHFKINCIRLNKSQVIDKIIKIYEDERNSN